MGNENTGNPRPDTTAPSGEDKLRGEALAVQNNNARRTTRPTRRRRIPIPLCVSTIEKGHVVFRRTGTRCLTPSPWVPLEAMTTRASPERRGPPLFPVERAARRKVWFRMPHVPHRQFCGNTGRSDRPSPPFPRDPRNRTSIRLLIGPSRISPPRCRRRRQHTTRHPGLRWQLVPRLPRPRSILP